MPGDDRPDGQDTGNPAHTAPPDERLIDYAIKYPFAAGWKTLFLGPIILVLSVLVLPFFVVFGYLIRVADAAGSGDETVPVIDAPAALFRDGVYGFAALLPLMLLGAIPYYLGAYVFEPGSATGAVLLLAYAAVGYVQPAVFVRYATHRDWREAYNLAVLRDQVLTSYYLSRFLLFWVLGIVLTLAAGVLSVMAVITVFGILIIPLLYTFYYALFSAAYWGRMMHGLEDND